MSSIAISAPRPRPAATTVFERILAGVDGTRSAMEAACQAFALAGPGTTVDLVAVSDTRGSGRFAQATLTEWHAAQAVASARTLAGEAGVRVRGHVRHSHDPAHDLLGVSRGYDLVAVGVQGHSRLAGILLGRTTARMVHSAPVPVLVARRPPAGFPGCIVAATAGPGDLETVELAARVALAKDAPLTIVHVAGGDDDRVARALGEQRAAVAAVLGAEPAWETLEGRPDEAVVRHATRARAGLVVVGSHGRLGPAAVGSVSERVAHHARCSVLVVRPPR